MEQQTRILEKIEFKFWLLGARIACLQS
jgi:hypothetical protein